MKRHLLVFPAATAILLIHPGIAGGQNNRTTTGTGTGFGSSGISVSTPNQPKRKVKIIQITALTPVRAWKNAEGRVITAALVAHDRPATEKDKPHVVVKAGIVRLLKDEKVFNIKLDTLSREDQAYVEELVYAIQEAEERKAAAAAATEGKSQTGKEGTPRAE